MEPIGLATGLTGLAGLFSVCLDIIDKVDSYKDFGFESRLIIAQFEADKLLFTQWAQAVGISEDNHGNNCSNFIINTEITEVVRKILFSIQEIFSKTSSTMPNLQSVVDTGPNSLPDGVLFLRGIKDDKVVAQSSEGALSKRSRIVWSLRGKEKLINQVQQFGALVERLHRLVPLEGAKGLVNVRKDKLGHDINLGEEKATWFSNSQRLLFEMEKQIEHERRKELGNWLAASWTNNDYCNLIQRKLDGTCGWILIRPEFSSWLSSDFPSAAAKILWINGPAGHGKTILCASVVHYLTTTLESPLAYYFCSSDSEIRRDPSSIVRSWISQVISCNRDAFEIACSKWEAKDGINASQTDIFELFKSIVQHVPNCTFNVDGLDECVWAEENWRSNNGNSPVSFFESLKHAVAKTNTRILILSRDEPEIRHGFCAVLPNNSHLYLTEYKICLDDVRPDTMLFSRSVVDKKLGNKSETLKHELSQQMVDRCGGMFLWVKMLEKDLRSWKNKKQLEETIKHAPTALARLYDRSWMKILHLSDKDRLRAFSILRWAAFALRPLTILEITEALSIIDDDNCEELLVDDLPDAIDNDYISSEILGLCGSLLETQKLAITQDPGFMTIHLTHFSVKQYILCNMPAQGEILISNERICSSAEMFQCNILAKLCLRYLNFRSVWDEPLELKSGPVVGLFRDYAAGLWHHHLQESASNYSEVIELANTLFSSENGNWESLKKWLDNNEEKSDTQEFQKQATSTSPLLYVSLFGPRETIKYLLQQGKVSVNDTNELKQTVLQAVATRGRTLTVKLLLENSADVTIADNNGWTPLNLASYSGYAKVVELLLENGADVTIADNDGWTPLKSASGNGHAEVVKLLLENGADVTIADNDGWTPLKSASSNGHAKVVKLLLEKRADITIASNNGWTPLNSASSNGHAEVVKLLLENGADVAIANNNGWTPLNSASGNGHAEVVKLLLENGADVTTADSDGWTPLKSASYSGHTKVVKLLLENGADIAIADNDGWTSLNLASSNGYAEMVKLLLENGADITIASNSRWTPLKSASGNGHAKVVKLLLENGADATIANNDGWTPLNSASGNGHAEVVKLLLENGADVTIANNNGWTPLKSASYSGHAEVAKLLLENGADIAIADSDGWTPLNLASSNGHAEVVKLLLEKGAKADCKHSKNGRTALSSAAGGGFEAVAKLLTAEAGVDWNSKDTIGRAPLSYAASSGHETLVAMLLDNQCVVPDLKDHYGATPLSLAARSCHVDVVKLLLATHCVDLNSQDSFGRTPLWWAGNTDTAQALLEYAGRRGISMRESVTRIAASSTPNDEEARLCDVCMLGIQEKDAYYNCSICNGGDFDICSECYGIGGRCLEIGHSCVKKKDG